MAENEGDGRYAAMVEFLCTFPSLSVQPSHLADLTDGVALFEALGEIAPTYFDPATIARHLGDNWALKASNLRKLVRNLEHYYHDNLGKTADFSSLSVNEIARNSDPEAIASLFELVAGAAINCDNRAEFVQRIMAMSAEGQVEMKNVIESSMERLDTYDALERGEGSRDVEEEDDDEKEVVFDDLRFGDSVSGAQSSGLFDGTSTDPSIDEFIDLMRERDDLRTELEESRNALNAFRNERNFGTEEVEDDNKKLRELTADLQERLERAQTSLASSEETAAKAKRQLEEVTSVAEEQREKNALLKDELDVANAKTAQLRKAEATALAYRKKLESVGLMNQQMQDLEDQSADYLRQILDLETANKQIPNLQKRIETMQEQIVKLELQANVNSESLKSKKSEIIRLKGEVSALERSKRMLEDEFADLRADHENGISDDDAIGALSLTTISNSTESREKIIRLEHENADLKKQLSVLSEQGGSSASIGSDSEIISKLVKEIAEKDGQLAKLGADKAKLETYTKKTLNKFQQKYMVALQECKAKLKEKHDRIEELEKEKESEKTSHKRESQLLSSTLYELGLAIMQDKLKQR